MVKLLFISMVLALLNTSNLESKTLQTDVTGQIVTYNAYWRTYVAYPKAKIELWQYDYIYQRWRILNRVFSDANGNFILVNVPPGNYKLFINDRVENLITVYNQQMQYVGQIRVWE